MRTRLDDAKQVLQLADKLSTVATRKNNQSRMSATNLCVYMILFAAFCLVRVD